MELLVLSVLRSWGLRVAQFLLWRTLSPGTWTRLHIVTSKKKPLPPLKKKPYMDTEIRYIICSLSLSFNPHQLLCGAPSLLLNWYWGFSPVVKSPGLTFITQLHLVPRSISLLALYTFVAQAGTTLFFPFAMRDATSENFVNYLIILLLKSNPNTQVSRWFSFRRE